MPQNVLLILPYNRKMVLISREGCFPSVVPHNERSFIGSFYSYSEITKFMLMEEVRSTTERKGNQGDYLIKKRERGSEREREETQQMGR